MYCGARRLPFPGTIFRGSRGKGHEQEDVRSPRHGGGPAHSCPASLQEDEDLQEIWANLLANTADIRQVDVISPAFPLILKELGARDVKFLDVLYQHAEDQARNKYIPSGDQPAKKRPRAPSLKIEEVHLDYIGMRYWYAEFVLGITNRTRNAQEEALLSRTFSFSFDLAVRHRLLHEDLAIVKGESRDEPYAIGSAYRFTCLGARFVTACRPPVKAE